MTSDSLISFQAIVRAEDGTHLALSQPGLEQIRRFHGLDDTPATLRAHAANWRHPNRWCRERGHFPSNGSRVLEAVVGNYLTDIHDADAISMLRRPVAIVVRRARLAQVLFDTKHPDIRESLRGTARTSTRGLRQATALATLDIQKLVNA